MGNVKELRKLFNNLNTLHDHISMIQYEKDYDLKVLQSMVLDMQNELSIEIDYREENYL